MQRTFLYFTLLRRNPFDIYVMIFSLKIDANRNMWIYEIVLESPASFFLSINLDLKIQTTGQKKMTMSHFIFKAYKSDLFGARYVWILIGTYTHEWWSAPDPSLRCTKEEMKKAVAYTFIFNNRIFVGEDKKGAQNRTLSGLVSIWLFVYLNNSFECENYLILCLSADNPAILPTIQRGFTEAELIIRAQHHGVHL